MQARLRFPILVKALLVGSILLAGCTGEEVGPPVVEVTLEPPQGPLEAGASANFTIQVKGDVGAVERVGLAWADSSTDSIDRSILIVAAFDQVTWGHDPPDADGFLTIEVQGVPPHPLFYGRGVVETAQGVHWSPESRLLVEPPHPPREVNITVEGLPTTSYVFNRHTVLLNVTGHAENATEAGFAWSTRSTSSRNETGLRPGHFDAHRRVGGQTLDLPGVIRFPAWEVPVDERLYLRAWTMIEGTYYWGNQTAVDAHAPPVYDHLQVAANHNVTIEPSALPLAHLAAFEPQELHLQVGESVRWVNQDDAFHTASHAANESAFHTGSLAGGASSLRYRFLVPGEYEVECRLHPETMKATLIVG